MVALVAFAAAIVVSTHDNLVVGPNLVVIAWVVVAAHRGALRGHHRGEGRWGWRALGFLRVPVRTAGVTAGHTHPFGQTIFVSEAWVSASAVAARWRSAGRPRLLRA